MWQSLDRLKRLPDETAIFCGHEYTLQNLMFAKKMAASAENSQVLTLLAVKEAQTRAAMAEGKPTVPGLMGDEKALNPFLAAQNQATFSELRRLKDEFRLEP